MRRTKTRHMYIARPRGGSRRGRGSGNVRGDPWRSCSGPGFEMEATLRKQQQMRMP